MSYISPSLRQQVTQRANGCCEYCLLSHQDHILPFEIDHIIAEKHKGPTTLDNLCLSCYDCNHAKGSDISSVDWEVTGETIALFNPRKQRWSDHFVNKDGLIEGLSAHGRVTVLLLKFNEVNRVDERKILIQLQRYPCSPEAFI
jgi:hypothetical protein